MGEQTKHNEVFLWRLDQWFPDLSKEVLSKLKSYHDELIHHKNSDFISAKSLIVADALHFTDSILASRIIFRSNPQITSLHDLGSGAGFPGLVLAILYPNIKITLVESDSKKCEFLNFVIGKLGLKNVTVLNTQIEKLPDYSVQYAICRGFGNITKTLLASRKIVPKGGKIFHVKGEEWGVEVSDLPAQICGQWSPSLVGEYRLPVGEVRFSVVCTDKIS